MVTTGVGGARKGGETGGIERGRNGGAREGEERRRGEVGECNTSGFVQHEEERDE